MKKNVYTADQTLSICWFRRNLRIHDNIILSEAARNSNFLLPLYIIDPGQITKNLLSVNRVGFLLESLDDLDKNLNARFGQRLFITYGSPLEVIKAIILHIRGHIKFPGNIILGFEKDYQPYEKVRDATIMQWGKASNIIIQYGTTQTLWNLNNLGKLNDFKSPQSMNEFKELIKKIADPVNDLPEPDFLPPPMKEFFEKNTLNSEIKHNFGVINFFDCSPSIEQLGMNYTKEDYLSCFRGGESTSLKKLNVFLRNVQNLKRFCKNVENPTKNNPLSSTQSPYLSLGCLSVRKFYHEIKKTERFFVEESEEEGKKIIDNLMNTIYWREYFYMVGCYTTNFDRMFDNPVSKLTDCWDYNSKYISAWKNGKTGYPAIDAVINQLITDGWTHNYNRQFIACFLTKGTLWQSWEVGLNFFQKHLIDFDWSINTACWIFLTNSNLNNDYTKVFKYNS